MAPVARPNLEGVGTLTNVICHKYGIITYVRSGGEFQYQVDIDGLAGEPVFDSEPRTDEEASVLGLHYSTLFDEDEDRGGELVDPATGERYDNSTYPEIDGLTVVPEDELLTDEQPDITDAWLARHDRPGTQRGPEAEAG